MRVVICMAIAMLGCSSTVWSQIRLLLPDSISQPTAGKTQLIVWNRPGPDWTFNVSVQIGPADPVEIAHATSDTSLLWDVPADALGRIRVIVEGSGGRAVQYGPRMSLAHLGFRSVLDSIRVASTKDGPTCTLWDGLYRRPSKSVYFPITNASIGNTPTVLYSPNLRYVALRDSVRVLQFYDMYTEAPYGVPMETNDSMAMPYNGIPSITSDGAYLVYSIRGGEQPDRMMCYRITDGVTVWDRTVDGTINSVVVHPKQPWFACASYGQDAPLVTIGDVDSGIVRGAFRAHDMLGWAVDGTVAFLKMDTSFVLRTIATGVDLPIEWIADTLFPMPYLAQDGLHLLMDHIRTFQVPDPIHVVYRYDLLSGRCVDSSTYSTRYNQRFVMSADGSRYITYGDSSYVFVRSGAPNISGTWKFKGNVPRLFDPSLTYVRVLRASGMSTYDLTTGEQLWNRQDAGNVSGTEATMLPNGTSHLVYSREYARGVRVIDHHDPYSPLSTLFPDTVVRVGRTAFYGDIPLVTEDSTLILFNAKDRFWYALVSLPFADARMIETNVAKRSIYIASATSVIRVLAQQKRIDTVFLAPLGTTIVGGTYSSELDEFRMLTVEDVGKRSTLRIPRANGTFETSDSIFSRMPKSSLEQIIVERVDQGAKYLVAATRVGFAVVDALSGMVLHRTEDTRYQRVMHMNDTLAVLWSLSGLYILDLRTLAIDTVERYVGDRFCRAAAFTGSGRYLTYYNSNPRRLLYLDRHSMTKIDSIDLPPAYDDGNLTVADDDCHLILSSEGVVVFQWTSCDQGLWDATFETITRLPTSVNEHANRASHVNETPDVTYRAGAVHVGSTVPSADRLTIYDQLGRACANAACVETSNGDRIAHVGPLAPGIYVVVVGASCATTICVMP